MLQNNNIFIMFIVKNMTIEIVLLNILLVIMEFVGILINKLMLELMCLKRN